MPRLCADATWMLCAADRSKLADTDSEMSSPIPSPAHSAWGEESGEDSPAVGSQASSLDVGMADLELSWRDIDEAAMVLEAGGSSSARSGGTPGAGPSVSPVMQVNATVVVRGQAASPAASGSPVVPVRTVEQQQQRQAQHAQQIMKRRSSGGLRDTPPLPSLAEEQARHAGSAPRGRMVARTPATPGVAAPASGDANDRPALGLALDSEAVLREMQAASAGGASEPVASSPEVMPDCMRVCLPPPVSEGNAFSNLVGDLFGAHAADALFNGSVHHQASAPSATGVFLKPPLPPNATKRCKTSPLSAAAATAAQPRMNGYHANGNGCNGCNGCNGNGHHHHNGVGRNGAAAMSAAGGAKGHSSSHSTC